MNFAIFIILLKMFIVSKTTISPQLHNKVLPCDTIEIKDWCRKVVVWKIHEIPRLQLDTGGPIGCLFIGLVMSSKTSLTSATKAF